MADFKKKKYSLSAGVVNLDLQEDNLWPIPVCRYTYKVCGKRCLHFWNYLHMCILQIRMQFLRLQRGTLITWFFESFFLVNINGTIDIVTTWGWKKWYSMPWLGKPFWRFGSLLGQNGGNSTIYLLWRHPFLVGYF